MRVGLLACYVALSVALVWFPAAAKVPIYGYQVEHSYPHDPNAYTEGLFYLDGFLYESTGGVGQSSIRKVRLEDGAILQSRTIAPTLFGEGIVNWQHEILSLTWKEGVGFRWNLDNFTENSTFRYPGEGWALTQDGQSIIMSDGTPTLRFLDPLTFQETRRLTVTLEGQPLYQLNELEWVNGEILANVWMTDLIARIDPKTGQVTAWINLAGLPETLDRHQIDDVLNGIAYDKVGNRLFVTGKHWPHLYEIRLMAPKN